MKRDYDVDRPMAIETHIQWKSLLPGRPTLTIPLISNEPVNIGEKRLLAQELELVPEI